MFKMLAQLWSMLTAFCTAGEKVANSLVILAKIGEDAAKNLQEEMNYEQQQKMAAIRAKYASQPRELVAPAATQQP